MSRARTPGVKRITITGATGRGRIYDGYPDVALEMISSRTIKSVGYPWQICL